MTVSDEHLHPLQEPDLLSWKWITAVAVGTVALGVLLSVVAFWAVRHYGDTFGGADTFGGDTFGDQAYERGAVQRRELPANTQLEYHLFEAEPVGQGQRLQAAERQRLESWGWVDRDAQIVRIPIDEAFELVIQERP